MIHRLKETLTGVLFGNINILLIALGFVANKILLYNKFLLIHKIYFVVINTKIYSSIYSIIFWDFVLEIDYYLCGLYMLFFLFGSC